jgi:hypothetical protein
MDSRTGSVQDRQAACSDDALPSQCDGCRTLVLIHLRGRQIEAPDGGRSAVTYADADIVVWDCPTCSGANAEVLREV